MGSCGLEGKVLLPLAGKSALELTIERLLRSRRIDRLVVATSSLDQDEPVAEACARLGVPCFRGSADDVLDRVYRCAARFDMDHVAHFGADNPLIDPELCDEIIDLYLAGVGRWDYVSNNRPPTFPDGQEVEITSFDALEAAWHETDGPRRLACMFRYLAERPERFSIHNVTHDPDLHHERWTLDYQEDYEFLQALLERLYASNPAFGFRDVIRHLDERPALRRINAMHVRSRNGAQGPTGVESRSA